MKESVSFQQQNVIFLQSQCSLDDKKVERQLLIVEQLKKEYKVIHEGLMYLKKFKQMLNHHENKMKNNCLIEKKHSLVNYDEKIRQMMTACITNQGVGQQRKKFSEKGLQKTAKQTQCSVSNHLKQIFREDGYEEEMKMLNQKKTSLYNKIKLELQKEQPYIGEKIFLRIQKEAKRNAKTKTIQYLQKQIKENQNWIQGKQIKIKNQALQKQIQETIVHNLQMMKQIMAKKVSFTDSIKELFGDEQFPKNQILKKVEQIPEIFSITLEQNYKKIKSHISQIKSKYLEEQCKRQFYEISIDLNDLNNFFASSIQNQEQTQIASKLIDRCQNLRRQIKLIFDKKSEFK